MDWCHHTWYLCISIVRWYSDTCHFNMFIISDYTFQKNQRKIYVQCTWEMIIMMQIIHNATITIRHHWSKNVNSAKKKKRQSKKINQEKIKILLGKKMFMLEIVRNGEKIKKQISNKMAAGGHLVWRTAVKNNYVLTTNRTDHWWKFDDNPLRRSGVIIRKPINKFKK